jgi:hypothetical protein
MQHQDHAVSGFGKPAIKMTGMEVMKKSTFSELTSLFWVLLCLQHTCHASALRGKRNSGGFFIFQIRTGVP